MQYGIHTQTIMWFEGIVQIGAGPLVRTFAADESGPLGSALAFWSWPR